MPGPGVLLKRTCDVHWTHTQKRFNLHYGKSDHNNLVVFKHMEKSNETTEGCNVAWSNTKLVLYKNK